MAAASVVIASRNKPSYLAATLACLARQTVPPDEVIIVDDGSNPPLADPTGVARLIRREGPRHLQTARNAGITQAKGDILLLMDDDCLVREDWVQAHLWRHQHDPGHLVVGSVRRIVYRGEREFWKLPVAPDGDEHRTFERRAKLLVGNVPPWNLAPCTNNASVARQTLLRMGGYDEEYRGWGVDDVDLTYRLMKDGVPLLIDSAPTVYHQEHPRDEAQRAREETRNLGVFAQRHGFWAYGVPPPEYQGPRRYPDNGAWFHAQALLREGEPAAIRVVPVSEPERIAVDEPWPVDWVLGGRGCPLVHTTH